MTVRSLHGWIVLDKPEGMTSNQVLSVVRRKLGGIKAGYAGTLDPFATGVLPIALGEATKLIDYMVDTLKTYTFTVRWGQRTDTDDREGQVVETHPHRPSVEEIEGTLKNFEGSILQTPPVYSALKIQGKRACDRARNQETVILSPRPVFVQSLTLLSSIDKERACFRLVCGKGTYVRSLARDLGEALGTVAHVESLCREAVGKFSKKKAFPYHKLLEAEGSFRVQESVHPMTVVLDDIPAITIGALEVEKVRQGQSISRLSTAVTPHKDLPTVMQLLDGSCQLVAMSILKGTTIVPRRVFVY